MKSWFKQNRSFIVFLFCFGIFRTAVADWNPIPSGSMRPTLLEGDVVLVNRLAYDLKLPLTDIRLAAISDPRRGDVVTFTSPKNGVRLIKRIVALPGDVVEMRDEVLYINGKAAQYAGLSSVQEPSASGWTLTAVRATENSQGREHAVQFLPEISARRSFAALVVPADSYFALGDNRDDSEDSRFIGFVPRHLLIGRAHRIIVSANIKGDWWPRFDRVAEVIR